ncbi:hypothetical protein ACJMK2_025482 [Sinanodonta woodiana]|uniref:MULE transposase domain-containing protein n=1 Tax=Sinanodonta woodiana TaxID=1069815 RepID=A0ABD3XGM6_SINWO
MKRVIRRARKRKGAMPANHYHKQQHWYADGTFKTVPSLFAQLYTIHGLINNSIVPAVFVSRSEKTEESYRMFFFLLLEQTETIGTINEIDIEIMYWNTTQRIFLSSFFCQCLYRNIQSNGLQHHYENDADFAMQMRHLTSLAFVPAEDVVLAFEELLSRVDFPLESQPVLDYFEDAWIGRPIRGNKHQPPRTPHSMWRWHRSLSEELIGGNHPTIWKFITVLQKEQVLNEAKIEQSLLTERSPRNCYSEQLTTSN